MRRSAKAWSAICAAAARNCASSRRYGAPPRTRRLPAPARRRRMTRARPPRTGRKDTGAQSHDGERFPAPQPARQRAALDLRCRVDPGGYIDVRSGKVEIGRDILTALAQIAAEELDVAVPAHPHGTRGYRRQSGRGRDFRQPVHPAFGIRPAARLRPGPRATVGQGGATAWRGGRYPDRDRRRHSSWRARLGDVLGAGRRCAAGPSRQPGCQAQATRCLSDCRYGTAARRHRRESLRAVSFHPRQHFHPPRFAPV